MASQRSVVPIGAVPITYHARGKELRERRASLNKTDRHIEKNQRGEEIFTPFAKPDAEGISPRLFNEPDSLSNMVLLVNGVELHVHKEMLASWSPVFMAMFSSCFTETETNKVVMQGKSLEDVRLLLNCIYPPHSTIITAENVMTLLPLVDEYDMKVLKWKCEEVLLTERASLDILLIAHEYNMPRLLESAITGCASLPMSAIDHKKNSELTQHIPAQHLLDVYREKIEQQKAQIKSLNNVRVSASSLYRKLQQWGQSRNSYPCDKHRVFDDTCILCLKCFRDFAFDQLQSLSEYKDC
ncbi:BTB and MATH domain-containing protein 36-like [Watersipora subatra]|uniref:BTB and MATH domain-containing protein 36-like n=1 Tax=Watersipora subatra TaxID=2589382 RepID=UPI00355C4901